MEAMVEGAPGEERGGGGGSSRALIRGRWIEDPLDYDGTQLRSHWAYRHLGLAGDCIVGFQGSCEVAGERLVDLEDRSAGATIVARRMVHFLVEHFDRDLELAIARQRLLVCIAGESIRDLGGTPPRRLGDDLHVGDRKLSVSVATASPVSTLIHLGINVDARGAPVAAIDLRELGIDAVALGREVLNRYVEEIEGAGRARCKVRSVP
jgi:hypothetical protein